jgi:hypothetical protein
MGVRIAAAHRWCVTGTPIGPGGMTDVLGLLRALHAAPFDTRPSDFQVGACAGGQPGGRGRLERAAGADRGGPPRLCLAHPTGTTPRPLPCPPRQDAVSVPYLRGRPSGRRALAALLRPLMWRNSKDVASADAPLPPRRVATALLRFSPAERSFYEHVCEKTAGRLAEQAAAAAEAEERRQAAEQRRRRQRRGSGAGEAQAAEQSGGEERQQQEGQPAGGAPDEAPASPRAAAPRGRRGKGARKRGAGGAGAGGLAAGELLQLRLACVHPQLTRYCEQAGRPLAGRGALRALAAAASPATACQVEEPCAQGASSQRRPAPSCPSPPQTQPAGRELSAELQLGHGGALSISEILARMVRALRDSCPGLG